MGIYIRDNCTARSTEAYIIIGNRLTADHLIKLVSQSLFITSNSAFMLLLILLWVIV